MATARSNSSYHGIIFLHKKICRYESLILLTYKTMSNALHKKIHSS